MSWLKEVVLGIDRLANAISGGQSENTISGRVGYHLDEMLKKNDKLSSQDYFWKAMARIIDWAFEPFDVEDHCINVYYAEMKINAITKTKFEKGSDLTRAILAIISIPVCLVIGILSRIIKWLK